MMGVYRRNPENEGWMMLPLCSNSRMLELQNSSKSSSNARRSSFISEKASRNRVCSIDGIKSCPLFGRFNTHI